jgi:hypothetical protein
VVVLIQEEDLLIKVFTPQPKDTPDYSNVRTGGGSPGQRSKDDKTSGDFPGKGSGNPFGR